MATSSSTPNAIVHNHAVSCVLGDDVQTFGFRIRDSAADAMDADDYTIMSQVKLAATDGVAAETWTLTVTDNGDDDTVDPDTVRVLFDMTAAETAALGVGSWVWDLQIDGPTGKWTPVAGTLSIVQDVTRP